MSEANLEVPRVYCQECMLFDEDIFWESFAPFVGCQYEMSVDPNHPLKPQVTYGNYSVLNKYGTCPHFASRSDDHVLQPKITLLPRDRETSETSYVAKDFVDRMEQHKEELRFDDTTYRLLFKLIEALRAEGLDAAPWWRH